MRSRSHNLHTLLSFLREIPSIQRRFNEVAFNDSSAEAYDIAQWYLKKNLKRCNSKKINLTTYSNK
jgi:hypothetical protein